VDKFKDNGSPTPALVVKLMLIIGFLLTAAFVSGIAIGKSSRKTVDRTNSDEEGINTCIAQVDECNEKYFKLTNAARKRGLVDDNDVLIPNVVCKPEMKAVEPEPDEKPAEKNVETFETSPQEKPEPVEKIVEKPKPEEKNAETSPETSPKKESAKPEKTEKPGTSKTIDDILSGKKVEQKPVETKSAETSPKKDGAKKCHFSIQIASLDSQEQVKSSKKEFKSLKLRVIDGENNGKKWYKIRTGCFDTREAAEAELVNVKKIKKDAFIVSE